MALNDYPLFRMNTAFTKLWLISPVGKREMANMMAKTYKTGVVVLSHQLHAIAVVDPRGVPRDLAPPFQQFEMWQIANKPSIRHDECACRNFYDPAAGGPWKDRSEVRGKDLHHPFCQFDRTAMRVYKDSQKSAVHRGKEGKSYQIRPDEWVNRRKDLL